VVYSVAKNMDFASNVVGDSAAASSGLGQAFSAAIMLADGEAAFVDFTNYEPAGEAQSFIAMPVYDKEVITGVMVLAVHTDGLSAKVSGLAGMGLSGEVVVVGADGLLRTESPRTEAEDVLATAITSDVISMALAGEAGEGISTDYRDARMVVRAQPVTIGDVTWAVVAVQPEEEAFAPVNEMRNMTLLVGGLLLALAALVGWLFSRSITRPITRLTHTMETLAQGDLSVEVSGGNRHDEIGAMARTVDVFRENALKVNEMTEAEAARIIATQAERSAMMQDLQRSF